MTYAIIFKTSSIVAKIASKFETKSWYINIQHNKGAQNLKFILHVNFDAKTWEQSLVLIDLFKF